MALGQDAWRAQQIRGAYMTNDHHFEELAASTIRDSPRSMPRKKKSIKVKSANISIRKIRMAGGRRARTPSARTTDLPEVAPMEEGEDGSEHDAPSGTGTPVPAQAVIVPPSPQLIPSSVPSGERQRSHTASPIPTAAPSSAGPGLEHRTRETTRTDTAASLSLAHTRHLPTHPAHDTSISGLHPHPVSHMETGCSAAEAARRGAERMQKQETGKSRGGSHGALPTIPYESVDHRNVVLATSWRLPNPQPGISLQQVIANQLHDIYSTEGITPQDARALADESDYSDPGHFKVPPFVVLKDLLKEGNHAYRVILPDHMARPTSPTLESPAKKSKLVHATHESVPASSGAAAAAAMPSSPRPVAQSRSYHPTAAMAVTSGSPTMAITAENFYALQREVEQLRRQAEIPRDDRIPTVAELKRDLRTAQHELQQAMRDSQRKHERRSLMDHITAIEEQLGYYASESHAHVEQHPRYAPSSCRPPAAAGEQKWDPSSRPAPTAYASQHRMPQRTSSPLARLPASPVPRKPDSRAAGSHAFRAWYFCSPRTHAILNNLMHSPLRDATLRAFASASAVISPTDQQAVSKLLAEWKETLTDHARALRDYYQVYPENRPTAAADRELDGRGVRVVVIRGEELVDPMLDHGVGAERVKVATTNQINVDFFEEL